MLGMTLSHVEDLLSARRVYDHAPEAVFIERQHFGDRAELWGI